MYKGLIKPLDEAQKIAYLARIGITDTPAPTAEELTRLVFAHHCSVPFENLDVCEFGLIPDLNIDALYDKVVVRRRGGYCFEMNAIFAALLTSLGFEVIPHIAKVGGPMGVVPSMHRVNLVKIDGQLYFCDVGLGALMPSGGLRFENDTPQVLRGLTFRFTGVDTPWAMLYNDKEGGPVPMLQINTAPHAPEEFASPNALCAAPGGYFSLARMVNLTLPNGSIALSNNKLTVRRDGEVTITELTTQREFYDALKEYYDIDLPAKVFPNFGF